LSKFHREAENALAKLQESLCEILEDVGEPSRIRPVDVSDRLQIDMNLAWKIIRMVNTTDLFSIGRYLPGRRALATFGRKSVEAGASEQARQRLLEASRGIDGLAAKWAGSRRNLELMLAALSTEEKTGNDLLHRRKAFEGNCYIFGVHSEIQLSTCILAKSATDPGMVDICRVRGQAGLSRTGPDVPWRLPTTGILDANGNLKTTPRREFLFPVKPGEPPLARDFCSQNLPGFGTVTDRDGKTSYYLVGQEPGKPGAVDIFTAEVMRMSGPLYGAGPNEGLALNNSLRTPARRAVVEVYIPADFHESGYEAQLWSLLYPARDVTGMTPGDRLALSEEITVQQSGFIKEPSAGMPAYVPLLESCFAGLKLETSEYRLLRIELDYPPIPTSLDLVIELPPLS
jgi:hypothetical protein